MRPSPLRRRGSPPACCRPAASPRSAAGRRRRLITASPIGGGKPSTTSATSPMRSAFEDARAGTPLATPAAAVLERTMICLRSCVVETAGQMRNRQPLLRRFEVSAGRHGRPFAGGGHHVSERDIVGAQAIGIDEHLELAVALAPDRHVGDAREWPSSAAGSSTGPAWSASICDSARTSGRSSCTRLSDDSGDRMTGGRAAVGKAGWRCAAGAPARADARPSAPSPPRRSAPPTTARAPTSSAACCRPRHAVQRVLERHRDEAFDLAGREARAPRSGSRPAAARIPGRRRAACPAPPGSRRRSGPAPARRRRAAGGASVQPASAS